MADNIPQDATTSTNSTSQQVVAKFQVTERTEYPNGGFGIKLQAVYGNSPENQRFFHFTPNASLDLRTVNASAADLFQPGRELYSTFSQQAPGAMAGTKEVVDKWLVSFGNYLLSRYGVQVKSTDGSNQDLYQRQVSDADLSNWRDKQIFTIGTSNEIEPGPHNPPKPPGDQPRG